MTFKEFIETRRSKATRKTYSRVCARCESNSLKGRKDPADAVCPSLWRAKKIAGRLTESGDSAVDIQKFESLMAQLDAMGKVVGCRFARASEPRDEVKNGSQ